MSERIGQFHYPRDIGHVVTLLRDYPGHGLKRGSRGWILGFGDYSESAHVVFPTISTYIPVADLGAAAEGKTT